jgi:hypothetical protein
VTETRLVPVERVERTILMLRGHRVILDTDLAALYGVPVKRLNEQIRRNRERFPSDFMFLLTAKEHVALRSQIATSKKGRGGRRYPALCLHRARRDHGGNRAQFKTPVEMSVFVVRAFVRMREMLAKNRQLAAKINELDRRLETHHSAIQDIIEAIRELMVPEGPSKRKIGFQLPPGKVDASGSRGRVAREHRNQIYLRRWR